MVCHATGNGGFVRVNVAVDDIVTGQGHGSHPRDIIPPFDYHLSSGENGSYPGQNWDSDGQAIWNNGCARPPPPTGRIAIFVSCVDVHGSTYDATFGYASSASGDVTTPVGSDNFFAPGNQDRGQVTVFSPGVVLHAFTVSGVTDAQLTWTVSYNGRMDTATASSSLGLPCSDPPSTEPDVPIGVFVTCVVNHGSTYDAVFGDENDNQDAENIPVGEANSFSPAPEDRQQPTVFLPGRFTEAVTVTGIPASQSLTWTLAWTDTRTAVASANFQTKCSEPPIPPIEPPPSPEPIGVFVACVTDHGSTYDATFGYVNENATELIVPSGPRNSVSPGPDDQGQPTTFDPGFVASSFTESGISASTAVTWRLIVGGGVRAATATASFPQACLLGPTGPSEDAGISKTATPATVSVGQSVAFKIRVFNNGSSVLTPFRAMDSLARGRLRVVSARSSLGRCRSTALARSSRVTCMTSTLAPGQSMMINVAAEAIAAGTSTDTATVPVSPVPGAPRDRTPNDNVSSATVKVVTPRSPASGLG